MIEIKPLEPRASWLHCFMCGGDDYAAADWIVTVENHRDKWHPQKLEILLCDDCLRAIVDRLVALDLCESGDDDDEETAAAN